MAGLTARTMAWRRSGAFTDIRGRRIFVREAGPDTDQTPLLFLHGYPSSSYDWRHAFDLVEGHRVLTFDFLGFGLSDKPRTYVYSLQSQADIVEALVRRFAKEPLTLVAHDMGSSVATELLARDLEGKLSFPSFAGIFSENHPLSSEEAADQWSLLGQQEGHRLLDRLIYYNRERVTPPTSERWHQALAEWSGRLELAWADLDPICTEAVLQAVLRLRPQAELTRLPGLGHYPQLEDPRTVYEVIRRHAAGTIRESS